jgi:hypothetical protein
MRTSLGLSNKLTRYGIAASTVCALAIMAAFASPVSAGNQTSIKSKGPGQVIKLSGDAAGLSKSALPGAQFISYDAWAKMQDVPKTGLFIVDIDFVPSTLPQQLKEEGLSLSPNGQLTDSKGNPFAVFTSGDTYKLEGPAGKGKQGGLRGGLWKYAEAAVNGIASLIVTPAKAGNPHPFWCASAGWSLRYEGGFCRSYRARTQANAWGPDAAWGCVNAPATSITRIETRTGLGGPGPVRTCDNCNQHVSTATWDIGCFWPAHGGTHSEHFAHLFDRDPVYGDWRVTWTARLTR